MSSSVPSLAPGAYKFTVKSAEEAVTLIRGQLGPRARVLSVRSLAPTGLARFFRAARLEVTVQVDPEVEPAGGISLAAISSEPAEPARTDPGRTTFRRAQPPAPTLTNLLRRSGLTEAALQRLETATRWPELNALPLHRALAETSRLLRQQAGSRAPRPPLARAAFLGTPGVGRTTALCKWLALEVFRRARLGHVVTVEFDRPNPLGSLQVFSEALGIPLAHFPCETQPAMPGGFVYFDLPGLSVRHPSDNAAIATFLDREKINERVLVLNAAYDRVSLRDAYAAGRDLGATHLVFTHLDEVPQWGKLWDYLFDEQLDPLFMTTGPSLTGDWVEDVAGAIARRTLADHDDLSS